MKCWGAIPIYVWDNMVEEAPNVCKPGRTILHCRTLCHGPLCRGNWKWFWAKYQRCPWSGGVHSDLEGCICRGPDDYLLFTLHADGFHVVWQSKNLPHCVLLWSCRRPQNVPQWWRPRSILVQECCVTHQVRAIHQRVGRGWCGEQIRVCIPNSWRESGCSVQSSSFPASWWRLGVIR